MKRLYLILESKKRELDSRLLFASKYANDGWSVVIGKKYSIYKYSQYYKRGIIFFKGTGPKNLEPMIKLKKLGNKIISFDEEGLGISSDDEILHRVYKKCLDQVSYFFSWGRNNKKQILSKYPGEDDKIIPCGNMRLDLLKANHRKFFQQEVDSIKKKHGKFVLLATKFTNANSFDFVKSMTPHSNFYRKEIDFQNLTFDKYKEFLKYFSNKNIDVKLIIRPHPLELRSTWTEIAKRYPNVLIAEDKMSTNSWILASEFIVSTNCHTTLDAYLLQKPAINFLPIKENYVEQPFFSKISTEINHQEELSNLINDWFLNKNKFSNIITKTTELEIDDYLGNHKSCMIDEVKPYIESTFRNIINNEDKKTSRLFFAVFKMIRKVSNLKNYILGGKKVRNFNKLAKVKIDNLSIKEMRAKIDVISEVLNIDKLDIKELYPGCFLIKKYDKKYIS